MEVEEDHDFGHNCFAPAQLKSEEKLFSSDTVQGDF
jgi:hypothetical protein